MPETSTQIVRLLTDLQHVNPHRAIEDVLRQATGDLGCCPLAVERAVQWLNLDARRSIGRLRRCELLQLSRAVDRFWRQATVASTPS